MLHSPLGSILVGSYTHTLPPPAAALRVCLSLPHYRLGPFLFYALTPTDYVPHFKTDRGISGHTCDVNPYPATFTTHPDIPTPTPLL